MDNQMIYSSIEDMDIKLGGREMATFYDELITVDTDANFLQQYEEHDSSY